VQGFVFANAPSLRASEPGGIDAGARSGRG